MANTYTYDPRHLLAATKNQAQRILDQEDVDWPAYEIAVDRILELDPSYGEPEMGAPVERYIPWWSIFAGVLTLVGIVGVILSTMVFAPVEPGAVVISGFLIGAGHLFYRWDEMIRNHEPLPGEW